MFFNRQFYFAADRLHGNTDSASEICTLGNAIPRRAEWLHSRNTICCHRLSYGSGF